jgi:glycerate kinase
VIVVPGASEQTSQVKVLNVNWTAAADGGDGTFEVMMVTADDEQHAVAVSAASLTALLAMSRAGAILLWDPAAGTLIAANIVGTWIAPAGLVPVAVTARG